jgi:hypothetical protein
MPQYCVDFDDLCDATLDVVEGKIVPLIAKYPNIKVTLFTIPTRTSPRTITKVALLKEWVQMAPHGWRHTRGECLAWSDFEAREKIKLAADMGIDAPTFRAPGWLLDAAVYDACDELGYAVASHREHRIEDTLVKEYIYNAANFAPLVTKIHGHLTPVMDNCITDMLRRGELEFPSNAEFVFPQDIACEY